MQRKRFVQIIGWTAVAQEVERSFMGSTTDGCIDYCSPFYETVSYRLHRMNLTNIPTVCLRVLLDILVCAGRRQF